METVKKTENANKNQKASANKYKQNKFDRQSTRDFYKMFKKW